MFYTADWKGERFPDGRPRLPDDLLTRALDVSIEDVWDFLRGQRYNNQFEGDFILLHPDKPFAGRAFTAQYMPSRPDMVKAFSAEGKTENRISWGNNNSWPINELSIGDIYVADGYGKIADGTLIGSNLRQRSRRAHPDRLRLLRWHPRRRGKPRDCKLQRRVQRLRSLRLARREPHRHQRSHPHRPRGRPPR